MSAIVATGARTIIATLSVEVTGERRRTWGGYSRSFAERVADRGSLTLQLKYLEREEVAENRELSTEILATLCSLSPARGITTSLGPVLNFEYSRTRA